MLQNALCQKAGLRGTVAKVLSYNQLSFRGWMEVKRIFLPSTPENAPFCDENARFVIQQHLKKT